MLYYQDLSFCFSADGMCAADDQTARRSFDDCRDRRCCGSWLTGVSSLVVAQSARTVLWERSSPSAAGRGGRTLGSRRPAHSPPAIQPDRTPADVLRDLHAAAPTPTPTCSHPLTRDNPLLWGRLNIHAQGYV